jgi:hypothetical protein
VPNESVVLMVAILLQPPSFTGGQSVMSFYDISIGSANAVRDV